MFLHSAADSFVVTPMITRRAQEKRSAIDLFDSRKETGDYRYSKDAASVFDSLRVPASLFAGAAAGEAFALPIAQGDDSFCVSVKLIYALLMISALSLEITAIVVSTLSIGTLTDVQDSSYKSMSDLLFGELELELVTSRLTFLLGLVTFAFGNGLRAWTAFHGTLVGVAALGIIFSGTLICLAFLDELGQTSFGKQGSLLGLPVRFTQLILKRSETSPLFALAVAASIVTTVLIFAGLAQVEELMVQKSSLSNFQFLFPQ